MDRTTEQSFSTIPTPLRQMLSFRAAKQSHEDSQSRSFTPIKAERHSHLQPSHLQRMLTPPPQSGCQLRASRKASHPPLGGALGNAAKALRAASAILKEIQQEREARLERYFDENEMQQWLELDAESAQVISI